MKTSAQKLISVMEDQGILGADQVSLLAEIVQAAAVRFMMTLMLVLSDDQLENLEKAKGTPAEEALVDAYCQINLGKSMVEAMNAVQDEIAQEYIDAFKQAEQSDSTQDSGQNLSDSVKEYTPPKPFNTSDFQDSPVGSDTPEMVTKDGFIDFGPGMIMPNQATSASNTDMTGKTDGNKNMYQAYDVLKAIRARRNAVSS